MVVNDREATVKHGIGAARKARPASALQPHHNGKPQHCDDFAFYLFLFYYTVLLMFESVCCCDLSRDARHIVIMSVSRVIESPRGRADGVRRGYLLRGVPSSLPCLSAF
jgi:hypothetical protein